MEVLESTTEAQYINHISTCATDNFFQIANFVIKSTSKYSTIYCIKAFLLQNPLLNMNLNISVCSQNDSLL